MLSLYICGPLMVMRWLAVYMTGMSNTPARDLGFAFQSRRSFYLLGLALVGGTLHCSESGDGAAAGTGGASAEVAGGVGGATGESGSAGTASGGAESVEGGSFGEGGLGNGGAPPRDTAGASAAGTGGSDATGPAGAGGVAGAGDAGAAGSGAGGAATGSGDAGAVGPGDAGVAGTAGEPPTNQIPESVGTPCSVDADCPTTIDSTGLMTCLTSSSSAAFGAGGPQGGYCSVPCQEQADCESVDNSSVCVALPGGGFCIGVCALGNGGLKCGADRPLVCLQSSPEDSLLGLCLPMCTSNAACGAERFCDTRTGLCVEQAPVGGGIGDACAVETAAADCASGICFTFETPEAGVVGGFCSASCTLFGNIGCGTDAFSTGPREAACVQPAVVGAAPGDFGFCLELCDTGLDCEQEDWVCDLFGSPEAEEALGRLGQCLPPELVLVAN